jgi:hypothetical protein
MGMTYFAQSCLCLKLVVCKSVHIEAAMTVPLVVSGAPFKKRLDSFEVVIYIGGIS